jgi:predicted membrane-bound spermidine synthase
MDIEPNRSPPAIALLFLSGLAALVYQTIWIKQLTLVVGVDVYAVTTGISGFFAGLALGSAVFGRLSDRIQSPLRIYVLLEAGIALLGISATLALAQAASPFVFLQTTYGLAAWSLPFVLVAIPAALMGGTLPPLLAAVRPRQELIGQTTGRLYAANTAGAIIGTVLTAFLLVPALGIRGAAISAAVLNLLLAAAGLVLLSRDRPQKLEHVTTAKVSVQEAPEGWRLAIALYAVAGGVALGYEVIWVEAIVQFLSTQAIAFSIVLATYLTGLVLGSWLYARFADRVVRPWFAFGILIAGAGGAALVTFALLGAWLPAAQDSIGKWLYSIFESDMVSNLARYGLATSSLLLLPTLLLGAAFPAAARLVVQPARAGSDVGLVLALNTALGIVGTVITGFFLIPTLGVAGSLGMLAFIAAVIGAIAIARSGEFRPVSMAMASILLIVFVVLGFAIPHDRLATLLVDRQGGELVFYDESPAGTVAVLEQDAGKGAFRRLYIQGVSNTGDAMPSLRYMRLQSLIPLLVHPRELSSALVVGFGTGITAGALLADPKLERRLVVELLRPVPEAAPLFAGNLGAGTDPRLEVRIGDGRHELIRTEERFDLITLEPPPPRARGVVNLYSRDFYELASKRLTNDGMLAQWWPIATQNDEDSQSLVRSMLDVFPYVSLWTTELHEMMIIGSMQPVPLNFAVVSERMRTPSIARALGEVGIMTPADLLATYVTDQTGLEDYAQDAMPVTDDRPRIEYAHWLRSNELNRILPKLLTYREPPPVAASAAEKARIEVSYSQLNEFYEILLLLMARDQEFFTRVRSFVRSTELNPYFAWFLQLGQVSE